MAGLFDDLPDATKSAPSAPPSALKPTADLFGDIAPAGSWTDNLRDPLAAALKIGPTAVKGVADIARLLTGDTIGGGLSDRMQSGMRAIDQAVGSDRLRHQQQQVANILQSDEFGLTDIPGMVADNPRAAVDAAISTVGSMFLPTGAAVGAVRALPSVAKVAPIVARVAPSAVATGTTIATGAAQNAAETFADTEGEALGDRYKGAAISGAISAALGGLMGGGAEGLVARRLAGESVARGAAAAAKSAATTGAKEFVQEFGEEGGNTFSKQVARGDAIDPNAIGKQGLYGGIIGMGVGGASDLATNVGNIGADANARILARELDQAAQELADTPVTAGEARSLFADLPNAPRTPESVAETVAGNADGTRATQGIEQQNQAAVAGQQPAPGEAARAVGGDQQAPGLPDAGSAGVEAAGVDAPVLQNRDRSTPGSVAQMQSIAADPDYGRLGFSRDFANGAPVVAGGQEVPELQLGRQDVAVASDGRRIPVQYAVVEAADVLPSNQVDGAPNADYATATDRMRAIAGNGRIAGLQAAHQRGTGRAYVDELLADNLHGINPDVVRGMRQPVLVRIMPTSEVTADIGDVSNTTGNLDLSAVEQARNDAQRVDLDALQFSEDGGITAEAARAFVRGMPQAEHGALLDTNGQPTRQAMDRLNAAVFSRAYGNDGLVRLYAQAQDPEARLVLSALARLAPKMVRLEGAGALDFRDVVAQAAELAVNARRAGRRIADAAAQMDMAADPMVGVVLDLFARNPRSNREAIEQLGRAADMAYAEANKADTDMFGAVPKASRADVFKQMEPATNEQASPQNLEQSQGPGPVQVAADRPAAQPAAPADTGRAEAGRPAESETGANSAGQSSDSVVKQAETQGQNAQGAINTDAAASRPEATTGLEDGNGAEAVPDRQSRGAPASTGNTTAQVRDALSARFGKTIAAMEQRGFLKITKSAPDGMDGAQGMYDGKTVHLFADSIEPGQEIGVFLHEAGEHASMEQMLGDRYAGLVARANELVREGDPDALAAQGRIPADTAPAARDSELLAYMVETVANRKPLTLTAKARRWLADVVAGVRAWWSQTAINRKLEKFGQGIQLTPADIAALAERAVYWQENQSLHGGVAGDAATKFAKKKESAPNPENLIVAHNLTAANILAAQELGGLAVPSLAVTKADAPIEGFGDITLVGDTTLATPGAKNPVFDADVYSPRFPRVQVKVNEKLVSKVLDPLRAVADAKGQRMRDDYYVLEDMQGNKLDTAISSLSYDAGARLGYASVVLGKDLAVPMKSEQVASSTGGLMGDARFAIKVASIDFSTLEPGTDASRSLAKALNAAQMRQVQKMLGEQMNTEEGFRKWVGSVNRRLSMYGSDTTTNGDGIAELNDLSRSGIARIKELAKNSAAPAQSRETVDFDGLRTMLDREVPREQMEDWLREQLTPAMGAKKVVKESGRTADYTLDNVVREMARKVRDAEGFNYGLGNARSKGATKFKNLAHIKSRRDQVVPKADFEKARDALDSEFTELVDAVEPYKTYERELAIELLAEAIGNSYTKPLGRALVDAGLEGVPAELQGRITTFSEKLRTAPTEYFEAKPQRGVGFDEFAGAVVPKGMDPAARKVLEDAGLTLVEYDKGDEGARARAVDQLSRDLHVERGNVRFSKNAGRSTTGGNVNSLASAAAPWTVPEPGTGDAFIRAIQNNKIDLKRLRDTIAEQYGPLPARADAYLSEELYHGKVGARVDQLHRDYVEPLLGKIAVAGKNAGVTVDDVNLYLHARHAPERNAAMQAINPGMANNDALSGMSDAQAAATMARFRADGKEAALQAIAADVDQLIADTRTNIVADGLEDAGVVQAWEAAYQHYVPLQRDIQGGTPKGMGFSVKGPEAKRAVGSNREVVNILANIVAQAETAAIRAEKSTVGRTLLDMARAYPNPDFWKVDVVPTKPRINKDTGLVERNAIDPLYQSADNVVMVKDQGQAHFIVFNKNSDRAMAVAHAMKNLDAAPMNKLLTAVGHGTRFLASMLTARNPVFWLTNFARDIQGAMLNLEGTDAEGLQREVLGNLGSAFKGMHALVRGDGRGQWARYAQELKDAGGTTGYMQVFENSDKRMGDIRKEVARMQQGKADPRRLARQLLEFVDDYNDIIENAVRLSVFQAARDSGVATERAASIAKNITVNFNRKGNLTPVVNSLYMFFNASVQGTARLAQLLVSSRKAQVAVGGIAMIGFLLDALNRAMSDDDEETGRNRYDLIPEFEKSKNWIIMNPMRPGEYVKIPLPLGPHVFHNAGRLLSDAMFRDDPRNAVEYSWAFVNTMMDAFSPLGETASIGQLIAPSIADPVLQLAENKSFTGAPVYKSAERGFGPPDPKPAYTRHFDSTPSIWKQASRTLNDITGGDKQKPGLVNIEPDILKHIAWTLTGGPGRTVDQAVDSLQAGARGVEMTPNRLPLASRFYGANDDRQRERVYYDDKKRVEQAKASFDYFNKNGRRDLAREIAEELGNGDYSEGLKMMRGHKGSSAALKKINSQIKREMERADSGEDRAEQLKALRKRRTEMMSRTVNRDGGEE